MGDPECAHQSEAAPRAAPEGDTSLSFVVSLLLQKITQQGAGPRTPTGAALTVGAHPGPCRLRGSCGGLLIHLEHCSGSWPEAQGPWEHSRRTRPHEREVGCERNCMSRARVGRVCSKQEAAPHGPLGREGEFPGLSWLGRVLGVPLRRSQGPGDTHSPTGSTRAASFLSTV